MADSRKVQLLFNELLKGISESISTDYKKQLEVRKDTVGFAVDDILYRNVCVLSSVIINNMLSKGEDLATYIDGGKVIVSKDIEVISPGIIDTISTVISKYVDIRDVDNGLLETFLEEAILSYAKYFKVDFEENLDDIYDSVDENNSIIKAIYERFSSSIINNRKAIIAKYEMLFRSGYDGLSRPYGILAKQDGMDVLIYTDSSLELKYRVYDEQNGIDITTIENLASLFSGSIGYTMSKARTFNEIAVALHNNYGKTKLLYFPYKLVEYAYGRRPIKEKSDKYSYVNNSTDWGKYKKAVIDRDLKVIIDRALLIFCERNLGINTEDEYSIIRSKIAENKEKINNYISFITNSFSTCVIMIDYKSVNSTHVSFRLRVSPSGNEITIDNILDNVFGTKGGDEGAYLSSSLNRTNEIEYKVREYAHEFNHKLNNAMPLFAYRALEALKKKKEKIEYSNLVLGQNLDGTILRNGDKVDLNNTLTHLIIAGSRSGKGVMTLNLLVGALNSNKAIIYLDNKPDMASMLSLLAGGNTQSGPSGFFLNGGYFADDEQHQFYKNAPFDINGWINTEHIPFEARKIWGDNIVWGGSQDYNYGDLFYMKALVLVSSIIVAASSNDSNEQFVKDIGGEKGIFFVCDEISRLQNRFMKIMDKVFYLYPLKPSEFVKATNDLLNCKEKDLAAKLSSFQISCNSVSYYALTYLKHLLESFSAVAAIRDAGLNRGKLKDYDIILIGQEIERKLADISKVSLLNFGYATTGRTGFYGSGEDAKKLAGEIKSVSFPLALTVLKETDALFGYNGENPAYLAQTDPRSNAFKKLDLVANNFCYLKTFEKSKNELLSKQLTLNLANNTENAIYFKPYLIINDSHCSADDKSSYKGQVKDRVSESGISWDAVIREYPNDINNPTDLDDRVGLPDYLAYMGVPNLRDRLLSGASIINKVLKDYIHYPDDGTGRPLWLQYVTDLRTDWLLTSGEIIGLCNKTLTLDKNNRSILEEYNVYKDFVKKHPELGIKDDGLAASNNEDVTENDIDDYFNNKTNDSELYYCQTCGHSSTSPISMPCPMCGGNPNESGETWTCVKGHAVSIKVDKCPQCGALRDISSDSDEEDTDDGVPETYDDGVPETYEDESDDGFGGTGRTDESSDDTESDDTKPEPIIFNTGKDEVIQTCATCGAKNSNGVGNPCRYCGGDSTIRGKVWSCDVCHAIMSDRVTKCLRCNHIMGEDDEEDYIDNESDEDNEIVWAGASSSDNEHNVRHPVSQPSPYAHTGASTYDDSDDKAYTDYYDGDFVFNKDGRFHLFSSNAMIKQSSANLVDIIEEVVGDLSRVNTVSIENGGHIIVNGIHINPSLDDEQIEQLPLDLRYKVVNGQWFELFYGKDLAKFKNLRTLVIADMELADKVCLDTGKSDVFKLRRWLEHRTKLKSFIVAGVEVEESASEYINDSSKASSFISNIRGGYARGAGLGSALSNACSTIGNSKIWNSGVGRFARGVAVVGGVALAIPLVTGIITGLGFLGTLNLAIACAGGAYNVVRKRKSSSYGSGGNRGGSSRSSNTKK